MKISPISLQLNYDYMRSISFNYRFPRILARMSAHLEAFVALLYLIVISFKVVLNTESSEIRNRSVNS